MTDVELKSLPVAALAPIVYPRWLNHILVCYYRAPDHPIKLRLWSWLIKLIGRKRLIASTIHRFKMMLDETDLIQRCVLHTGDWEPEISALLSNECRADDVFFDVGANVGFDSCLALTRGVKQVVGFDPDPTNGELFKANVNLNGFDVSRVHFVPKAVSNATGKLAFRRASSANTGIGALSREADPDMLQVDVVGLDDVISASHFFQPTIMKIDVEGWEHEVLLGAVNTLKSNLLRLIVFESDCNEQGEMIAESIRLTLEKFGFVIERVGPYDTKANYVACRPSN